MAKMGRRTDHIAIDIEKELESLPALSHERCIFRVPDRLRRLNPRAFSPQVVSIGPLHHGQPHLAAMELHKRRYLRYFLHHSDANLEACVRLLRPLEHRVRGFYTEDVELSSDEFVKMVLVDTAFLIQFLLMYESGDFPEDQIGGVPRLILDIRYDLCLLENQIPLFLVRDLFQLAFADADQPGDFILNICLNFVADHFKLPPPMNEDLRKKLLTASHIVELQTMFLGPIKKSEKTQIKTLKIPTTTELYQAGVRFRRPTQSSNIFDILFQEGILEIPPLVIADSSELFFRNMLAYEQCLPKNAFPIANYVLFIRHLVNSGKDAGLLIDEGILDNWLKNNGELSALFNDLSSSTLIDLNSFYFAGIVEDLNGYCAIPNHKWQASLKQDYFNTPWAAISVIAGGFLMILSVIQAVCAVIESMNSYSSSYIAYPLTDFQ